MIQQGKWTSTFSKGPTDLGCTDITEHKIHLTDNKQLKEPYRRFPPIMFEEVKEHLKEMLDAGAIHPMQSSFSSNIVLVRKIILSYSVLILEGFMQKHSLMHTAFLELTKQLIAWMYQNTSLSWT